MYCILYKLKHLKRCIYILCNLLLVLYYICLTALVTVWITLKSSDEMLTFLRYVVLTGEQCYYLIMNMMHWCKLKLCKLCLLKCWIGCEYTSLCTNVSIQYHIIYSLKTGPFNLPAAFPPPTYIYFYFWYFCQFCERYSHIFTWARLVFVLDTRYFSYHCVCLSLNCSLHLLLNLLIHLSLKFLN